MIEYRLPNAEARSSLSQPGTRVLPHPSATPAPAPILLPLAEPDLSAYMLFCESIDGTCLEAIRELAESRDALVLVAYTSGGRAEEVKALEAGADECVPLGFSVERVLAQLRRASRRRGQAPADPSLQIWLDEARYQVHVNGRRVQLSPLEFRLLAELWRQRDRLVSHERVEKTLYDASGSAYRQAIRQVIRRLRIKLGSAGEAIHAVAGAGYVLSLASPFAERPVAGQQMIELSSVAGGVGNNSHR